MSNSDNFLKQIDLAYQELFSLPPGEIKYYLYLLVTSIRDKNTEQTLQFLIQLRALIETLNELHQLKNFDEPELNNLFDTLNEQYHSLGTISETNQFTAKFKIYLLNACGATLALISGLFGGMIGGIVGFVRGIWNFQPFRAPAVGFFSGILMGGILGFRLPKKLVKDVTQRQIKFGLDGVNSCLNEMQKEVSSSSFFNSKVKPISVYYNEVTTEIRALFSTQEEYELFLHSDIDYSIDTLVSTFIGDPMLAGYIGHHSYIKINIQSAQYLVEFAPEPSDISNPPTQTEKRTVSGKILIDMLAYHRKLQETHACNTAYILTKAKPGDTDCLSYVDKVLIGTN